MKVLLRNPRRELDIDGARTVAALLAELDLNREGHLVIRNGTLVPGASLYDIEREAILRTLEMVNGSTSRAAEVLGISVRKIQYRLKEYAGEAPKGSTPDADS